MIFPVLSGSRERPRGTLHIASVAVSLAFDPASRMVGPAVPYRRVYGALHTDSRKKWPIGSLRPLLPER
jgi:hypothetical protein